MKRIIILFISVALALASAVVVLFAADKTAEPVEEMPQGFYGVWTAHNGEYTLEITEDGLVKADNTVFFDIYSNVPLLSFRKITENIGVVYVHYPEVTVEFACELDGEILIITPPVYYSGALVLKREGSSADTNQYLKEHYPHLADNG